MNESNKQITTTVTLDIIAKAMTITPKAKRNRYLVGNRVPEEVKDKIIELYNQDMILREIRYTTHISLPTIGKIIKERREHPEKYAVVPKLESERNIPGKHNATPESVKDYIVKLYNKDVPLYKIAQMSGKCYPTVKKVLKERYFIKTERELGVKFTDFQNYFFKKDIERKFSQKQIEKYYEVLAEQQIGDYKSFVDKVIESAKK